MGLSHATVKLLTIAVFLTCATVRAQSVRDDQGDRAKEENEPRTELLPGAGRLLQDSPGTSRQEGSGISADQQPIKHALGPGRNLSRGNRGPARPSGQRDESACDTIAQETFLVDLPKLGLPPDEEGEGWIRPRVWGALDPTATDDTITVPNGRPIYALIVSGYESNKYLDELMVYNFARHLMARGAYVHYAWWNNLLAPYMERPLHHPQSDPGFLDSGTVGDFLNPENAAEKAFPGEDYQFVADARLFVSAIREHNPSAMIILVGHSMGGGAVVHVASQTNVVIDILAPIDPVGNRNYPWGQGPLANLFPPVDPDYNWTRWRVSRDNFLGYKSAEFVNFECVPTGEWLKSLSEASLCFGTYFVHSNPDVVTFDRNVINLHHRYQQEAKFPYDFYEAYHFGHSPPLGRTNAQEQGSVPMTPADCGFFQPPCSDPGGLPDGVDDDEQCCWTGGSPVGWDLDGHGEIVGYRGPVQEIPSIITPLPLGLRVRTSPHCGASCSQGWPARSGTSGNWSNGGGLARKQRLQELENLPANFVWEHRPTNPELCLVSQGLIDLFDNMNRPPEASAGEDQIVECMGQFGAEVTLDGSGSSDPDDDALTYTWTWPSGSASGLVSMVTLPLGTHCITLTVRDPSGHIDTDVVAVTVQDTTGPDLTVELSPNSLWPPNHKLVDIQATVEAADLCGQVVELEIVSIVSSEEDDGHGDGHTTGDIMGADMNTLDLFFQLRAERAGGGHGRVYTVIYQATDDSGNRTETSAEVIVRH